VFNQSITGANEIVTILFIYTTALGAAISIGRNEHIGIDFFVSLLPKKLYKTIRVLQVFLIFALHLILFIYCLEWVEKAGGYLMPATGLPRIVAIASIPIGCIFCILFCAKTLIDVIDTDKKID
tara:strand:- start:27 stop:398 length:372 start_codon:yes stop_codon:yes gene_type:complete